MFRQLILAILIGLFTQSATAADSTCPGPAHEAEPLALLHDTDGTANYGLFECARDGGLYLFTLEEEQTAWLVNESWWFYDFASVRWGDNDTRNEIVVTASYVTGIGPTGAEVFYAAIPMLRGTDGWHPGEPEFTGWADENQEAPDSTAAPENAANGQLIVRSEEAFAALALTDRGRPVHIPVDYESARLVLQPVWLTSGSQQIEDVKVRRTRGGYRISYRIRSPRTGTTDMKRSIIYTVLPADGLPVIAEEGHGRQGSIVKTDTGVIDAGAFTGAPAP